MGSEKKHLRERAELLKINPSIGLHGHMKGPCGQQGPGKERRLVRRLRLNKGLLDAWQGLPLIPIPDLPLINCLVFTCDLTLDSSASSVREGLPRL